MLKNKCNGIVQIRIEERYAAAFTAAVHGKIAIVIPPASTEFSLFTHEVFAESTRTSNSSEPSRPARPVTTSTSAARRPKVSHSSQRVGPSGRGGVRREMRTGRVQPR